MYLLLFALHQTFAHKLQILQVYGNSQSCCHFIAAAARLEQRKRQELMQKLEKLAKLKRNPYRVAW